MVRQDKVSETRERILETADRLFYEHGMRTVGIDRIVAEADVAKMSLYKYFPSKDDLILACLQHREETVQKYFTEALARHEKRGQDKLRALFSSLKEWFSSDSFRGCAFQNAVVELADPSHPGTEFARNYKKRFQDFLVELVKGSVGNSAAKNVPAINLLIEGAIVTAVIQNNPSVLDVAREAALKLLNLDK